jgi:tubulin-specific chaperone C
VKALGEKLQTVREGLKPRPKFTFKGQLGKRLSRGRDGIGKPATSAVNANADEVNANGAKKTTTKEDAVAEEINIAIREERVVVHRPSFLKAQQVSISKQTKARIQLPHSSAPPDSSTTLSNLDSCVVDMSAASPRDSPLAGLTLRDISQSVINCGGVSGPIHITGATDSIIVVTCGQFRMHECKNVDVYLQCGSKPIVEDVEGVRFAPLANAYVCFCMKCLNSTTNNALSHENLHEVKNMWDQVDDFKWLKSEHSPHWSILAEPKRLDDGFWTNTLVDDGLSVDAILKAARLT